MVNDEFYNDFNWAIFTLLLAAAILLLLMCVSCTKPEYCMECHKKDGGTVIYCGYTDEQFRYVYQWNCEYLQDTMECKTVER